MKLPIDEIERPHLLRFALAACGAIVLWAVLHDQYLIRIEPRHFTEYHREILPLKSLTLIALQFGILATFGPGLAYGILLWLVGRGAGRARRLELSEALPGLILLLVAIESVCLFTALAAKAGAHADKLWTVYPRWLYPELTEGLLVTQTINVTAYLCFVLFGALYLRFLWRKRKREPAA